MPVAMISATVASSIGCTAAKTSSRLNSDMPGSSALEMQPNTTAAPNFRSALRVGRAAAAKYNFAEPPWPFIDPDQPDDVSTQPNISGQRLRTYRVTRGINGGGRRRAAIGRTGTGGHLSGT